MPSQNSEPPPGRPTSNAEMWDERGWYVMIEGQREDLHPCIDCGALVGGDPEVFVYCGECLGGKFVGLI